MQDMNRRKRKWSRTRDAFTINPRRPRISRGRLSPILVVLLFVECSLVVNGQSHIVDSTLLVEGSVNNVPAVFLLDTGAEHSALDKHFATQIGLNSVSVQTLQHPFQDELSGSVWVRDFCIQSIVTKCGPAHDGSDSAVQGTG
jgi:Aspartyl protease